MFAIDQVQQAIKNINTLIINAKTNINKISYVDGKISIHWFSNSNPAIVEDLNNYINQIIREVTATDALKNIGG